MNVPSIQAGTTVELTETLRDTDGVIVDLTGASLIEYEVMDPSGALHHWTATAVSPPTSGVMLYVIQPTDCVIKELWSAQAHVIDQNGAVYRTDPALIQWFVKPNLPGA